MKKGEGSQQIGDGQDPNEDENDIFVRAAKIRSRVRAPGEVVIEKSRGRVSREGVRQSMEELHPFLQAIANDRKISGGHGEGAFVPEPYRTQLADMAGNDQGKYIILAGAFRCANAGNEEGAQVHMPEPAERAMNHASLPPTARLYRVGRNSSHEFYLGYDDEGRYYHAAWGPGGEPQYTRVCSDEELRARWHELASQLHEERALPAPDAGAMIPFNEADYPAELSMDQMYALAEAWEQDPSTHVNPMKLYFLDQPDVLTVAEIDGARLKTVYVGHF